MAVLEAVKGWEALSGEKSEEESADTEPSDDKKDTEEITWSEDQLKHQLDPLLNQDYVSLLLAHETHLNHEPASLRESMLRICESVVNILSSIRPLVLYSRGLLASV